MEKLSSTEAESVNYESNFTRLLLNGSEAHGSRDFGGAALKFHRLPSLEAESLN